MDSGSRSLRVVVGMPFATPLGGAERLLQTFLERAGSIAVEPHVVFFEDGPWPDLLEASGIGVDVIDPGRFREVHRNVAATAALRRLLRDRQPDVTLGWITRAQVTLAPAAVAAGLRHTLAWYQHTVPAGELIERAATLLPAQLVLTCSEAGAEAQRAAWPRRAVEVAHPGIEMPDPLPPSEIAALRERLGVPAGRAVLGISGRLVRWKGQDRFIRAVQILRDEGRDVHGLVIGGSGHGLDLDFEPELRALVGELGLTDRVTFTGQVTDAMPHTQLLDVAVSASEEEPFGMVLLEAMALETPVVAVDKAGPREIVAGGETGVLVGSADPEALAAGVRSLLDDPPRAQAMARAGRSAVSAEFTTEHWLERIRAGLERVAARGS